jgi:pimeloyl-ACP methyl ester carboxylesterase
MALLPNLLSKQFAKEAKGFEHDPEVASVVTKQLRELEFRGYIPALLSSLKGVLASRMENEHKRISKSGVAVRALFAENDKTIPIRKAKPLFDQWSPNADIFEIAGAGHGLTYTHPEQVMDAIGGFLDP